MQMKDIVVFTVTPEIERTAHEIRFNRDKILGNNFKIEDSDMRYLGEIAEICTFLLLKKKNIRDFKWIRENVTCSPDFIVNGKTIDVKSVKRKTSVRYGYGCQVTAKQVKKPVDYYLFTSYEPFYHRLSFLGGTSKTFFLDNSRYYKAGERVHSNYVIRPGHAIYNIGMEKLTPIKELVKELT